MTFMTENVKLMENNLGLQMHIGSARVNGKAENLFQQTVQTLLKVHQKFTIDDLSLL